MLQFLYRVQPVRAALTTEGPTPAEAEAIDAHFLYLQDLAAHGRVLLAGRTQNEDASAYGIVLFVAETEEGARRLVDGDPAVQAGVMRAELHPFRVAIASPALGRLVT